MRILPLLALLPLPALAEPAPPYFAPGLADGRVGVFCDEPKTGVIPAPGTELGYINVAPTPHITWPQQRLPARIGLAFGVIVTSDHDMASVRITTTRPGQAKPDTWSSDIMAGTPDGAWFSFEFPEEQVPGLWTMEAHDGDRLLFHAEFEVLPPGAMPELACGAEVTS